MWQGLGPKTGLLCPHLAPKLGAATATPGHLEPADSAHGTRCQGRINPGVWAQSRQRGRAPLACPPPWRAGARFPGHSGVPTRAQGLCTPHAGQSKPTTQAPLETWGPSGGAPTGTTGGLGRENGTCQKKASGLQDITKTPPGARALACAQSGPSRFLLPPATWWGVEGDGKRPQGHPVGCGVRPHSGQEGGPAARWMNHKPTAKAGPCLCR